MGVASCETSQTCSNTEGSYVCECGGGYLKGESGTCVGEEKIYLKKFRNCFLSAALIFSCTNSIFAACEKCSKLYATKKSVKRFISQ